MRYHFLVAPLCSLILVSAASAQKLGDFVFVTAEAGAPLKSGETVVATIEYGKHLKVEEVNGAWLRARVGGEKGWIHRKDIVSADRAAEFFTEAIRRSGTSTNYRCRGNAYGLRGERDAAIADYDEAIRLDPADARAFHNRGNQWRIKGEFTKAIADFDEAIRLDPKMALAYYNRGLAHDAGGTTGAFRDFDEAVRLDPAFGPAYAERGIIHHRGGKYDDALADLSEAIRLDPQVASYYYVRATILHEGVEDDRALADFEEAIRLDPKHVGARFERAILHEERADPAKAIADYTEVLRLEPEYLEAKFNLVRLLATCPDAKLRDGEKAVALHRPPKSDGVKTSDSLAAAYAETGDYAKAIKCQELFLDWAYAEDPLSPEFWSGDTFPAQFERDEHRARLELYRSGQPYREDSKLTAARLSVERAQGHAYDRWYHSFQKDEGAVQRTIKRLNEAIRIKPDFALAYYQRAEAWDAIEEHENAAADLAEAIRLAPQYASLYRRRAEVWRATEAYDKAIGDYNQALRLNANDSAAYEGRGQAWLAKGEYESAVGDFNEAIRLEPKNALAYMTRGRIRHAQGRYDGAIEDYDKALELDDSSLEARYLRGLAYHAQGDYDKAIQEFNAFTNPGPAVYSARAAARAARGEYPDAIQDYEEALRLHAESASDHNNLAWLLATCPDEKHRDGKRAVELAKRACELNGTDAAHMLDTLAAAHAESGNFAEAVKCQTRAVESAPDEQKNDLRSRLELYQSGKPYHEDVAPP